MITLQRTTAFRQFGLTVRDLRALAGMDLDSVLMGFFVLAFLARLIVSVVDRVVRGTGGVFALLGDLVEDVRLGFFFAGVVRHVEMVLRTGWG